MFEKYKNLSNTYTVGGLNPDMFNFDSFYESRFPNEVTKSQPYYVLIEYQIKEKIDILYGLEMNVTKREGLWLDLVIPDNAKAERIMYIINNEISIRTNLQRFTIITINDL